MQWFPARNWKEQSTFFPNKATPQTVRGQYVSECGFCGNAGFWEYNEVSIDLNPEQ